MSRFKEFRERAGLKQGDVEDAAGVYRGFVSKIENGQRQLLLKEAPVFARILRCTVEELIEETEEEPAHVP